MRDYDAERFFEEYHRKTFFIDPTPFLESLTWFLSPPDHILDVGCGSGRDLLWFQRRGYQVTGVERSAGLARLAREVAKATIYEADFDTLDFTCLCVHALVLIGALVHHPLGRFAEALKRMLQALSNNMRMGILVHNLGKYLPYSGKIKALAFCSSIAACEIYGASFERNLWHSVCVSGGGARSRRTASSDHQDAK